MARFGLSARIAPGVELNEITIKLDRFAPPVVTMRGQIVTGSKRVDSASVAEIRTMHLTPAGRAFIDELKTAFGGGQRKD